MKPSQEILQQALESFKQRVEDMRYVSYDGTLLWKIEIYPPSKNWKFKEFKEFNVWSSHMNILCVSLRSTLSWVVSNSISNPLIVEFP